MRSKEAEALRARLQGRSDMNGRNAETMLREGRFTEWQVALAKRAAYDLAIEDLDSFFLEPCVCRPNDPCLFHADSQAPSFKETMTKAVVQFAEAALHAPPCPECIGTGRVGNGMSHCWTCNGTGTTLRVKVDDY